MNRGNKILFGMLAFIVVCVVGYALFSDTISVTGNATAKGEFKIDAECYSGISEQLVTLGLFPSVDHNQFGFENSICEVKDNKVTATTDLLYPTARRNFTVVMKNTGTIESIVWFSSLANSGGATYKIINSITGDVVKSGTMNSSIYSSSPFVQFQFYPITSTNEYEPIIISNPTTSDLGIKLEPGDSLHFVIYFDYFEAWSRDLIDNGKSEYYEFQFYQEFQWDQFIDNSNYKEESFDDYCINGC